MQGRSLWRSQVFWVWLSTALALPLLAAAPAVADVDAFEVKEYARDFDVTHGQAEEKLEIQNQGSEFGIVEELEGRLGNRYSGVWFDNDAGEFVVPILPNTSRIAIENELAAADLDDDFRIASAQSSWQELDAAHRRLDEALMPLIKDGFVRTSIDPRTNAVVIDQTASTGGKQRMQILDLVESEDVEVEVRQRPAVERFREEAESCSFESKVCGYPLRGGVVLGQDGGGGCTTGFKATGNTFGNRFILTAGHCAETWPTTFYSFDANDPSPIGYTRKDIGSTAAVAWPGSDWAAINANGSEWDGNPWPSQVAYWQVDHQRAINYESSSYMGQQVCHSGIWTGSSCGYVTKLDKTVTYDEGSVVYHMTEFAPICHHKGDSGGPVFIGNTAMGIFSGAGGPECGGHGNYSEITEATSQLGVTVATGAGAKPYAETWDATNIIGDKASANGKVDPNGMPTTYRFEYGTTTAYGSATESYYAGASMSPSVVSATISGLQPGTTYHYRISSSNGLGQSNGDDKTFKTNGYRYMLGTSSGTAISSWNSVLGEKSRPARMGVGDFTGDKKSDIVAVEKEGASKYRYMLGVSNGSGIASWSSLLTGMSEPKFMAVGDVTGDGKADVVSVESEGNGKYRYVLGISTGTGINWNNFALTGMSLPTFMRLGDVNGDGKADVVSVESEGNGKYRYMLGLSIGTSFSWGSTSLTQMSGPWSVSVGDVTGNKKADVVAVESEGNGSFRYMLGTSTGSNFTWGYLLTGMSAPYALALGDVNADGKADIVADESEGGSNYRYMFGLSTGSGISPWGYALTGLRVQEAVGVGDLTGDGKADVVGVEPY